MPAPIAARVEPRKTPVQARSNASVEAILEATIQVLVKDGRARLTTTRVAERAGVSVGTLYQYFPNKEALLHALLKNKLTAVADAVEKACGRVHGSALAQIAEELTRSFTAAKFRNPDASAALYAAAEDTQGKRIAQELNRRATKAIAGALASASDHRFVEPQRIAATLFSAMAGISRGVLEAGASRGAAARVQQDLLTLAQAYLFASGTPTRAVS